MAATPPAIRDPARRDSVEADMPTAPPPPSTPRQPGASGVDGATELQVARSVKNFIRKLIGVHYPQFSKFMQNVDVMVVRGLGTFAVTKVGGKHNLVVDADLWNKLMHKYKRLRSAGKDTAALEKTISFLALHEAMHIAYRHLDRLGRYPQGVMNIASDVVVNDALKRLGVLDEEVENTLSEIARELTGIEDIDVRLVTRELVEEEVSALLGKKVDMSYMTDLNIADLLETIRRRLPKIPPEACPKCRLPELLDKQPDWKAPTMPLPGVEGNHDMVPEGTYRELVSEGKVKERGATADASVPPSLDDVLDVVKDVVKKMRGERGDRGHLAGRDPGAVESEILRIKRQSGIDWRQLLSQALVPVLSRETVYYTYSKLHRRIPLAPGQARYYDRRLKRVAVLVDVSGSIDEETLKTFLGEVMNLACTYKTDEVYLVTWDAEVQGVEKFSSTDLCGEELPEIKITGGGGTVIDPALKRILEDEELGEGLQAVVVFTDGIIDFTDETANLAREVANRARVAVYAYTLRENPQVFGNWIRVNIPPGQ